MQGLTIKEHFDAGIPEGREGGEIEEKGWVDSSFKIRGPKDNGSDMREGHKSVV